jgi:hypothetical protein
MFRWEDMPVPVPTLILYIAFGSWVGTNALGAKASAAQSATSKAGAPPADQLPLAAEVPCSEAPRLWFRIA